MELGAALISAMALSITLNTLAWGEMLMVSPLAGESVMVPSTALVGSVVTFIDIPGGKPLMLNSPFSPILIGLSVCAAGGTKAGSVLLTL